MINAMDTLVVKTDTKINATAVRRMIGIKADASGKLPERLELVKAGKWENSWKGDLEITATDLLEMKANLEAGVGLPAGGSEGAPLDYSHEDWKKAAGWMKSFDVVGDVLYATEIEWTPAGEQAVRDGEFKFFSPSFYPRCRGLWADPEDPTNTAYNVVLGGGLTNQPFFKGLKGLKASQSEGNDNSDPGLIFESQERKLMTKTLEDVRKTPVSELTDEDKAVLKENIAELSADEQVSYGLAKLAPVEDAPAPKPTDIVANTPEANAEGTTEALAVQASIKAGTHKLVAVDEHESLKASVGQLQSTVKGYERERIDASVAKAIERGAIKPDQAKVWGDKIEADASMADILTNLPDNKILASELGDSNANNQSATKQIQEQAKAIMASAKENNETIDLAAATSRVLKENPELASQYLDEARIAQGVA